jgi:hypothetical protein
MQGIGHIHHVLQHDGIGAQILVFDLLLVFNRVACGI